MNVHLIYFSPTGTTQTVLRGMFDAERYHAALSEYDLTNMECAGTQLALSADDLAIFGFPVYGGRVPKAALERLRNIKGENTPAVLIATYGNRDYDDALLECADVLVPKGFRVFAAAAVVTEHSIVRAIASGRPNEADWAVLRGFADQIMAKDRRDEAPVTLKGNRPYRVYQGVPLKPKGSGRCNQCGTCAKLCPVGAIATDTPRRTNRELCISCMRCIKYCPQHARGISKLEQSMAHRMLADKCKEEKESTLFL